VSINRKKLGALLCVAAVGIAVASTAGAAQQGSPGITKTSIKIGGTFPLTGGASLYATIAYAEEAYYAYVNAHGGVNGRKITDIVRDDQYDPSKTLPLVKQLVEQNKVFAVVGSLGTAPGLATWGYLNTHQVPQVLLATGDAYWGTCTQKVGFKPKPYCKTPKPWTMGWQPDYPSEARLYAKQILKTENNPKIGVLYQNDAYGQNYLAGFLQGLGSHTGDVVDKEKYNFGDSAQVVGAHVGALEAHGANTVVIFATPTASIQALATMGGVLHWSPTTYLNNVSANRLFVLDAEQNGATPNGIISSSYIGSQTATPSTPGMKLAKKIIDGTHNSTLIGDFNNGDNNIVYGLAVAYTFVDALKHAGTTPTRASFMAAIRNLHEYKNPFVYPGIGVQTSKTRTFPMQQLILEKWKGTAHDWRTFGSVIGTGF